MSECSRGFLKRSLQSVNMSELRDDLLIHGYIRRQKLTSIPIEVLELIHKWFHIAVHFEFYDKADTMFMNTELTSIKLGCAERTWTSCYGSLAMSSTGYKTIYEYTIKILDGKSVALGLVDAAYHDTSGHFYDYSKNKSKYYAIFNWFGKTMSHEDYDAIYEYGPVFNDEYPTIMKLIYDADKASLSFEIKGKNYGEAFKIHKEEGLEYRLAIYNGDDSAHVEIMGLTTIMK